MYIDSLYIYPIKSCGGMECREVTLTQQGFRHDRAFVVVDQAGIFLSQRSVPRMSLIKTRLQDDELVIRAPNMPERSIALSAEEGPLREVTVWGDQCRGLDQGDDLADWFSEFLGLSCRLVRYTTQYPRIWESSEWGGKVSVRFADAYPLLIISQASLSDLNQRLAEPLPMNRFRPNLVIADCEPYAEDAWREIRMNSLRLRGATRCVRCAITTVDQTTGDSSIEPLRTLAQYRKTEEGVVFGRNFIPLDTGSLLRGTEISVTV